MRRAVFAGGDAPKFKDYILPLIFVKRISDVFEDALKRLCDEFGDEKVAYDLARKDHKLVRFFIPRSSTWPANKVSNLSN